MFRFLYIAGAEQETPETCGSPANTLVACSLVAMDYIAAKLICKLNTLGVNVGDFLACVIEMLPSDIDDTFESIINGLVAGGVTTLSICPYVINFWSDSLNSMCSDVSAQLDALLGF